MKKEWIQQVQDAGIVGAGGAGFPTHVKLNAEAEYLVVNGAECEPLLRVDQQLMQRDAEILVKTLDKWVEAVGAKQGIFGLKEKYHGAIDALEKAVAPYPRIAIHAMPNVYPAGDEQFLVYETVGRVVPEGGIPLQVGVIVVNAGNPAEPPSGGEGHSGNGYLCDHYGCHSESRYLCGTGWDGA